jgi:hypothetical protein
MTLEIAYWIIAALTLFSLRSLIRINGLKEKVRELHGEYSELGKRRDEDREEKYKAIEKYDRLSKDITYIRAKEETKKKLLSAIINDCLFIPIDDNLLEVWNKDKEYLWDITDTLTIKRCKKSTNEQIRKMETIITDNIWNAINHPLLQGRDSIYELVFLVKEIEEEHLLIKEENV